MFQLADVSLANHQQRATTFCGTGYYQAPELYPQYGVYLQSPKMDVWCLFVTIIDFNPRFTFPPLMARICDDILRAVHVAARDFPVVSVMARENPTPRPSAAQLLVAL